MPLPLIPASELDLSKMDRQSLLARLQTLAYQVIPTWSDFSPGYPENMLLEAQALLSSMVSSVLNERARQLTKATVTDRLAMIRLATPFGYSLASATAAQTDGTFYLPNGALATSVVTIPIGTRVKSGDAQYQTMVATTIQIGNNASSTVTVENAESQTEQFTSDETVNQIIQLSMINAVEDSDTDPGHLYVIADDGQYRDRLILSGAKIRSFLEASPDDRVFVPLIDNNGRVYIYFGNSINGKIPQGTISVEYKVGGGETGRVGATATWTIVDSVYDAVNSPITVLFQNPAASVGGYDATSIDEARARAPLALRTVERCVNEEDFEYIATLTPGVARAAMLTSNQDTSIPEDEGHLYVVAYGSPYTNSGYYPPAAPTAAQLAAIAANIAVTGPYPQVMGVDISVLTAIFTDITVKVRIYKESGYTATQVSANINESLQKFFAVADDNRGTNMLIDFGYKLLSSTGAPDYKIAWSDVLNVINDTSGVREIAFTIDNLLLNEVRQSVILSASTFPRLSTVTIYDMDNSGVII